MSEHQVKFLDGATFGALFHCIQSALFNILDTL